MPQAVGSLPSHSIGRYDSLENSFTNSLKLQGEEEKTWILGGVPVYKHPWLPNVLDDNKLTQGVNKQGFRKRIEVNPIEIDRVMRKTWKTIEISQKKRN